MTAAADLDLPLVASGKVREIYDLGDDRLLLVASDRISTYDVVHPNGIPDKGKVLTGISAFWFNKTGHIVPNHYISSTEGAAENTANRLREAGWNVTETGNLSLSDISATTVFFSDAPGEREAADEVGKLLQAPVQPRVPELTEQPPGVVVAVTG